MSFALSLGPTIAGAMRQIHKVQEPDRFKYLTVSLARKQH